MAFSQNRFGALLEGEDKAEVDKLGNTKPSDTDDRPIARPRRTHQPAMSPPSRRARGDQDSFDTLHKEQHKPDDSERKGRDTHRHGAEPAYRGRQYDRRSGEVNPFGTKKKNDQSWGHLEESQIDAATDGLSPKDPDAPDGTGDLKGRDEDDNVMTLDEYMKNRSAPKQSLPPPREANDGKEDPKWKDGVVVHRPDDEDYYAGKDASNKSRTRTRKEKVFIAIDPPRHQPQSSRGRGGRGGHGVGGDRGGHGVGGDRGGHGVGGDRGRGSHGVGGDRGRGSHGVGGDRGRGSHGVGGDRGRGGRGSHGVGGDRGRGGRGGHGVGGDRGRGGGRNQNVNLSDVNAFPTLS